MNDFQLWTDAQPVREHVRMLSQFGIGHQQLAKLANVKYQVIKALMGGHTNTRGQETKRIMAESARRLLQIRPTIENVAPNKLVDSKATQRRIQALSAIGYSFAWQAEQIGSHAATMIHALRNAKVTKDMNDRVENLFNTYAYTPRVAKSELERRGITKTKNHAKRNGWVGAAYYENSILDEPEKQNRVSLQRRIDAAIRGKVEVRFDEHEFPEAISQLSAANLTQKQIGRILNCSEVTVRNIRKNKGQKWNREFTARNSASMETSSPSQTTGSVAPA